MTDTYYTVRRETAHCKVDYSQKFTTRAEAEAYMTEAQRYSLGGTFSIVISIHSRCRETNQTKQEEK